MDDEASDLRAIIKQRDEEIAALKEENQRLADSLDRILTQLEEKER